MAGLYLRQSFRMVVAQIQALHGREYLEVMSKRGSVVSLAAVVAQVQALQRRERLKVRANRGGAVSFDIITSENQVL
jgi:hypothetical protein